MLLSVLRSDFRMQVMKTLINIMFFRIFAPIDSSDF